MAESTKTSWLLAAWPGMGNVAVIAAGHLIQKLGLQPVVEMAMPEHFDVQAIEVQQGVISPMRLPRSVFFRPGKPLKNGLDLTVFVGEAQPAHAAFKFAHALLDRAAQWNVDRVVTFASMASQLHPSEHPRVYGAATRSILIDELQRLEVKLLEAGQIAGMNGVLLGAAAERNLDGLCLLGEIPFFAAGVANPKAARAVLDAFTLQVGLEIDMEELGRHAEIVDRALAELLERMQSEDEDESEFTVSLEPEPAPEPAQTPKPNDKPEIDDASKARIERLFEEAAQHRSRAVALKKELDRLGVFKQYENRFLDLFKRAE